MFQPADWTKFPDISEKPISRNTARILSMSDWRGVAFHPRNRCWGVDVERLELLGPPSVPLE